MKVGLSATFALVLSLSAAGAALCQTIPPPAHEVDLSGPRFGITSLSTGIVDKLKAERGWDLAPVITQFGWQFEKQFFGKQGGPTAVTEGIVLFGGLEQGVVIPSVSWLVGVRASDGTEIGVGPNITPAGVALALAVGKTFRAGVLNVPVNIAVVPSRLGLRVSLLTGFSLRR